MPYVTNDKVRIHYEVIGDGPPLFLHHGFTQSMRRWHFHGYVEALKADNQLILIDARGHGKSDKPHDTEMYAFPAMANDALAVLNELGIQQTRYWGFSMGGRVGFELASLVPDRISSFILGGMHPYARESTTGDDDGSDPEAFAKNFFTRLGVDPDSLPPAIREDVMSNDFRALAAVQRDRHDVSDGLANITGLALIYAGDKDVMYDQAKQAAAAIPQAKFVTLPGLDHSASFRDPDLMLPHVREVLASV